MTWLDRILSWFHPQTLPPVQRPVEPFDAAEVIRLMNVQRLAAGLSKLHDLREDPDLTELAASWARHMAAIDTLGHGDFQARIMSKFPDSLAGEVIAAGQTSAREVVDSWMSSTGHRAQILGSAYSFVGVGREVSATRTPYWCADFV